MPSLIHHFDSWLRPRKASDAKGVPLSVRITSGNGAPFASLALGGLSQLSKWWIKLGIKPERIQPGKPSQNGRHERMHRTLKDAVAPQSNLHEQQRHYDPF